MPRDAKVRQSREAKTPATRKTLEFTEHLYKKLCSEKAFPKRSRWLFSGKIADLANDFETEVFLANETKITTRRERDERHYHLTMAVAKLLALDAKITQACRILEIKPETMELYANYVLELQNLLNAWLNADEKRYGPPSNVRDEELVSREFMETMFADFQLVFRAWAAKTIKHYAGQRPDNEGDGQ